MIRHTSLSPFELVRTTSSVTAPILDAGQQQVVDHQNGPLLVLAGPGTGKTTTMVEAIAARVAQGVQPDAILALTFSRKAAEQLRDRLTARLGAHDAYPHSQTLHSFAYSIVRTYAPVELYPQALSLLSAAEHDVVLRELLTDEPEAIAWPAHLQEAVGTRGFAREVGQLLSRAHERGIDPAVMEQLGHAENRPELVAAAQFFEAYLDILDSMAVLDYAGLMGRAASLAYHHRERLRARFDWVFVDEYQDTDPGQVRLLQAIAGDGGNLVVVGDPDQSIYGFRGADVRGILDFPSSFPHNDGTPAQVVTLDTVRRFGPNIAAVAQRVAHKIGVSGAISADQLRRFRTPRTLPDAAPGRVDVFTYESARAEAEHIANHLRSAHLHDEVPWSQMAVLVRAGQELLPAFRRILTANGVPVEVALDEISVAQEPAVEPLLTALRLLSTPTPQPALAVELLLSPLGEVDAMEHRRIARSLLRDVPAAAAGSITDDAASPVSSDELIRDILAGTRTSPPELEKLTLLAERLAEARALITNGAAPYSVLWSLWNGSNWSRQLYQTAISHGPAAAEANRDLDAICALFEAAQRMDSQSQYRSIGVFLDRLQAQELPADTMAERGIREDAVRLLTAHRAKGLEWEVVVVAHVQQETWPDLRYRATLFNADQLTPQGLQPPTSRAELLAEERRLFYVALTRARSRLIVTAVKAENDEDAEPSQFIEELGVPVTHISTRPQRPLSLRGLVAQLRRVIADPDSAAGLKTAAAHRLLQLRSHSLGTAIDQILDPDQWWGSRDWTRSDQPLRPAEAIELSASTLSALEQCSLRWFFDREAGGVRASSGAQGLGVIVHALAAQVAAGALDPDDEPQIVKLVDTVWPHVELGTPWGNQMEREELLAALRRFLAWHATNTRTTVAAEARFRLEVTVPAAEPGTAPQPVVLVGQADRVELTSEGQIVIVDLKTGKYHLSGPKLEQDIQLGFYQYATNHGAFEEHAGASSSAGAELVQLRTDTEAAKVQHQSREAAGVAAIEEQLALAARRLRTEEFTATAGDHCRLCDFKLICPVQGQGDVFN